MTDLDGLRQRILARKALAEAATPGPWGYEYGFIKNTETGAFVAETCSDVANGDDDFIADRDPAAVIHECDADLALNDWCVATIGTIGSFDDLADAIDLIAENLEARYPVKGETP